MSDLDEWLKKLISTLDTADRLLADELRNLSGTRSLRDAGQSLRNIVLRVGRPVLAVVGGGALSLLATGFCAWAFPSIRRADRFVPPDPPLFADSAGKGQPDVECAPLVAGLDPKAERGAA